MWKHLTRAPQNLLPLLLLTGGFTLIAVGFGRIFGSGVGLVVAGVLMVCLQWWLMDNRQ